MEDDKNKVTILSELLADEAQYFCTDPSIGEENGNLDSSNMINASAESRETYSNEFNGFAELISTIKVENQTDSASFIPSENYASYTDISYNTKTCSRLSTDTFVNLEPPIDMNNGQSTSNHFEKSTEQNLPQLQHLPQPEIIAQQTSILNLMDKSHNQTVKSEQIEIHPPITIRSVYGNVKIEQSGTCQSTTTLDPLKIHQPNIQQHVGVLPKSNGISETSKTERLTSSLRLYRKPNFRQSATASPKIKTKRLTIRLDRSIVDDFLASRQNKTARLLQPVVVLKRIEHDEDENSVKRPKSSRIGKRKQNRAIWDGEKVSDKITFKRRRDDTDDAEGSSGFTGGSSGNCYSSDSQTSRTSSNADDTPPPKSTNGGASESTGDNYKMLSCKLLQCYIFT